MAVPGYVLKNRRTTLERAEKFISELYFTDCNLYGRLYPRTSPVKVIQHFAAPGRIEFKEAVQGSYSPASIGESFGPTWSTHWFKLDIEIPDSWVGEEVRLIWDSETEAMVWKDGDPLQGLTPENRRTDFVLSKKLGTNELKHCLYIEMVCNKLFGAGSAGTQIGPTDPNCYYKLCKVELAVIDKDVHALIMDLQVITDIVKFLPTDSNRSYQALYTANDIVNTVVIDNRETYRKAHEIAQTFFSQPNGATQHDVIAVGNCHIDTAWLWPYAETKRKCARSFSATIRLLDDYPEFKFVCSQAQQFEWVKQDYPLLYDKIKKYVALGRFIPVGGTWVEMDGYMPSGEGFIRQFLLGQKFFKKEFGAICKEFWLPDTFGYSAQLPQIMKLAGISRFVTQKISWNLVNKFPHHTFWWSGIDGSQVLTHFPPGDKYEMQGKVEEVMRTLNNFQDKGRSNSSLFLYGYGDGGQGPTQDMIERLNRMKDCDGVPKVTLSTPDAYFDNVEKNDAGKLCSWAGELYLELHNGTYTTQASVKKNNRKSEFLLRDLEVVASLAFGLWNQSKNVDNLGPRHYPTDELERLWKLVLLNQFHDVLPGSSINLVYKDCEEIYADVFKSASSLLTTSTQDMVRTVSATEKKASNSQVPVIVNTHTWERSQVIALTSSEIVGQTTKSKLQIDSNGNALALVTLPPFGFKKASSVDDVLIPATAEKKGDYIYLRNGLLEAVIDSSGRLVRLSLAGSNRNAIAAGSLGNQFVMFDDVPLYWDAWDVMDYHLETRKPVVEVTKPAVIVSSGPVRASVEVSIKISDVSHLKQVIVLDASSPYVQFQTTVEWHENHKFLKIEFPVDVVSPEATYEIQFGHLRRPTHFNTSWDWAKFEVCGHKWADVSEYDYGVAVLNDSKYGWSCIGNVLRLSLLRSPKAPDETADMGLHTFTYAIMPHTGTFQSAGVVQAAYNLNNEFRVLSLNLPESATDGHSYVKIDQSAIILEALKLAEDRTDALVLRLYEAYGSHVTSSIQLSFPVKSVQICDVLERPIEDTVISSTGSFQLSFKPFQIVSVLLNL